MSQFGEGVVTGQPHNAGEIGTPEWNVWALLLMIVREFIIDLLGSLLPGLLFVCFAGPLLCASVWLLWASIAAMLPNGNAMPSFFVDLSAYKSYLTLFTLALAYVLGCIFYRLDPKTPDVRSAERILNNMKDENDLKRAAIQAERSTKDGRFHLKNEPGAQFPYSHLYDYLRERELVHLARLVRWRGSTDGGRTKMFINILKVRLQFSCPENCADIVRNEAHVRLMSSVWYAASTLVWVAGMAVIPGFAGVMVCYARGVRSLWVYFIGLVLACGSVALGADVVQRAILRFLHYQRVREIVYVLEAVWFASKRFPHILEDLLEPVAARPSERASPAAASGARSRDSEDSAIPHGVGESPTSAAPVSVPAAMPVTTQTTVTATSGGESPAPPEAREQLQAIGASGADAERAARKIE
jgi:hypothetical protein